MENQHKKYRLAPSYVHPPLVHHHISLHQANAFAVSSDKNDSVLSAKLFCCWVLLARVQAQNLQSLRRQILFLTCYTSVCVLFICNTLMLFWPAYLETFFECLHVSWQVKSVMQSLEFYWTHVWMVYSIVFCWSLHHMPYLYEYQSTSLFPNVSKKFLLLFCAPVPSPCGTWLLPDLHVRWETFCNSSLFFCSTYLLPFFFFFFLLMTFLDFASLIL